jgi:hypothetical protein
VTPARGASFAVLTLAALATSGCGIGKSYVLSADYASSMNDSEWHVQRLPKATPEPESTTIEPASEKNAAESSVSTAGSR